MSELKRLLSATNISFTEFRFETDVGIDRNPFTLVRLHQFIKTKNLSSSTLQDPDGRIFILSMYAGFAREILCMVIM